MRRSGRTPPCARERRAGRRSSPSADGTGGRRHRLRAAVRDSPHRAPPVAARRRRLPCPSSPWQVKQALLAPAAAPLSAIIRPSRRSGRATWSRLAAQPPSSAMAGKKERRCARVPQPLDARAHGSLIRRRWLLLTRGLQAAARGSTIMPLADAARGRAVDRARRLRRLPHHPGHRLAAGQGRAAARRPRRSRADRRQVAQPARYARRLYPQCAGAGARVRACPPCR